jgi:2-oxoglutarate dehydrogenase E1 component
VLCSGKIYYDLLAYRLEHKVSDTAIVRIEQLYPLPQKQLQEVFAKHKNAQIVWAQEEPENMGAYTYLLRALKVPFTAVTRPESASQQQVRIKRMTCSN